MTHTALRAAAVSLVLAVAACGDGDAASTAGGGGQASTTAPPPAVPAQPSTIAQPSTTAPVPVPSGTPGAGRTFRPSDTGTLVLMRVGETAEIVIPDPLAPELSIEGASVQLVEVKNVDASGRREWEVRATRAGRTVVRGAGSFPFQITFDVSA